MEIVKYHEITIYAWSCPKCGYYNEEDEDPGYKDYLYCEECDSEFKPEEE